MIRNIMEITDAICDVVDADHVVATVLGSNFGPEFDPEWAMYMPEDIDPEQERLCDVAHAVLVALANAGMLTAGLVEALEVEAQA